MTTAQENEYVARIDSGSRIAFAELSPREYAREGFVSPLMEMHAISATVAELLFAPAGMLVFGATGNPYLAAIPPLVPIVGASVLKYRELLADRMNERVRNEPDFAVTNSTFLLGHAAMAGLAPQSERARFDGLVGMPARQIRPINPYAAVSTMLGDLQDRDRISGFLRASWPALEDIAITQSNIADDAAHEAVIDDIETKAGDSGIAPEMDPALREAQHHSIAESLLTIGHVFLAHYATKMTVDVDAYLMEQDPPGSARIITEIRSWQDTPPSYSAIQAIRTRITPDS